MAQEITIDLGVKPTLDTQATRNLINSLEKELRKVQTGTHLNLSKRISSVYDKLIESGLAATPTSARIAFSKLAGGSFSEKQQGVLRLAEGMTAKKLVSEKQEAKKQVLISSLSARTAMLQQKADAFKEEPNEESKTLLIGGIIGIRRELLKLYQEYRVNRRQVPPILRQISQNTAALKREISDFDTEKPNESAGGDNFLKKFIGKAATLSTLMALARKGTQAVVSALNRGAQAMRLQAAYGKDVNWGDVRARAGIFNMSTESAAATSEYASDFRQRMMWGEISEREIIGLSRAGRWGRMVMSGEAAKNPVAANQAFEELVTSTDKSKMRSILRQLGLSQELMQYNIQGYDKTTREEYNKKFGEIADKEWEAAVMMYDAGNQYQVATEQISEVLAQATGKTVQYLSPQGRMAARNLGVEGVTNGQLYNAQKTVSGGAELIRKVTGNPFAKIAADMINVRLNPKAGNTYNPTINNNITIEGNADENTVAALRDEVSRPEAIINWAEQANLMGGRTNY